MIGTRQVRTRYGTRRVHYGRCPVPGCAWKGEGHYRASLAQADYDRHVAREHPRPTVLRVPS